MSLAERRILLTGSTGGLGRYVGAALLARRASLATISRTEPGFASGRHLPADLSSPAGLQAAIAFAQAAEPDILINLAGVQYCGLSEEQPRPDIWATYVINLVAPALLTQAVLAAMKRRGSGQIVNVGSILGSVALGYFSTYSSSKAGLRSFSEALRRELVGTGVIVTYVAPRAVRTNLITPTVAQYADLTGMTMDEPIRVAEQVVNAIEQRKKDIYFGLAELLSVKLNALLPRLIDRFVAKNDRKARALFGLSKFQGEGRTT